LIGHEDCIQNFSKHTPWRSLTAIPRKNWEDNIELGGDSNRGWTIDETVWGACLMASFVIGGVKFVILWHTRTANATATATTATTTIITTTTTTTTTSTIIITTTTTNLYYLFLLLIVIKLFVQLILDTRKLSG
jgi:hypothetical protein